MARPKKHVAHQNHERWMVSYADFVTLLFAFFVVMYATARIDETAPQRVSESVREALKEDSFRAMVATLMEEKIRNPGAFSIDPAKKKKSTASKADAVLLEQFLPSMDFSRVNWRTR
ncbi:MAG: flagellar motor protein MotB [Bryobacterales bacterium]|nr:flagellar motor protein MotB [Bryobacterales bacterium]